MTNVDGRPPVANGRGKLQSVRARRDCSGSSRIVGGLKVEVLVERRWPGLFFQNVGSGCVTDRRVVSAAHSHRRRFPSRSGLEPIGPIRPPAAVMLLRAGQPRLRRLESRPIGLVGPMAPFTFGRWVDHPGDMPTRRQHKARLCAIRQAERQGTMWSFSAPIAYTSCRIKRRSMG
jgi:hypothetical protein